MELDICEQCLISIFKGHNYIVGISIVCASIGYFKVLFFIGDRCLDLIKLYKLYVTDKIKDK